jgi:hypothetical protein
MFGQGSLDKETWFEEAKRAYEEFCRKRAQSGQGLGTFSELEQQSVEAGDRLARFLIASAISNESTESDHREECDCPRCGKPAKRRDETAETRELHARPGAVAFGRQAYYCVRCRKVFFPNGPRARSEG